MKRETGYYWDATTGWWTNSPSGEIVEDETQEPYYEINKTRIKNPDEK